MLAIATGSAYAEPPDHRDRQDGEDVEDAEAERRDEVP